MTSSRERYGLLLVALAPVAPQILGSAFNIWYNATVVEPLLAPALRQRFFHTTIIYNAVVYPAGVYLWLKRAPIQIGIGINSGPAIVGSIGSPQRLEFTAIGNTVNIASRVQGLTKTTGEPLLVTAAVRDRTGDCFSLEQLLPQQVRGIEERLAVFAVRCET